MRLPGFPRNTELLKLNATGTSATLSGREICLWTVGPLAFVCMMLLQREVVARHSTGRHQQDTCHHYSVPSQLYVALLLFKLTLETAVTSR